MGPPVDPPSARAGVLFVEALAQSAEGRAPATYRASRPYAEDAGRGAGHIVQGTPEIIAGFGEIAAVPKLFVFDKGMKRVKTFYGAPPDLHQKIEAAVAAVR